MMGMLKALRKVVDPIYALRKMPPASDVTFVTLGSDGANWTFVDDPGLVGSTIVSCGLGEDVSFEVAFARRYGARLILVDPTPRAVAHVGALLDRIGQAAETGFVPGAQQPVAAYDMAGLRPDQLVLDTRAIWNEETTIRFYAPKNPDHVSHSILNFQNDYSKETEHIEVPTVTLGTLAAEHGVGLAELPLIKIDIEGAEIEVVTHMLKEGIRPRQICVEFDELGVRSKRGRKRVLAVVRLLKAAGYRCVFSSGRTEFTFLLDA